MQSWSRVPGGRFGLRIFGGARASRHLQAWEAATAREPRSIRPQRDPDCFREGLVRLSV